MERYKLIENLGFFTIASGLLVYMLQKFIILFFNRKLKSYELEIKLKSDNFKYELDRQLENHKTDLNILLNKSSKLQEKRLIIIAKLYSKIIILQQAIETMTALVKEISVFDNALNQKKETERIEKAKIAYNNFQFYFNKNRIFFPQQTAELIDKLKLDYFNIYYDYILLKEEKSNNFQNNWGKMNEISSTVKEDISQVVVQLDNDFRNLLGSKS